MGTILTFLAAAILGEAAAVIAQLVAMVALVVSITAFICGIFKIEDGAWNGWAKILISWVVSIGLCFACYYLGENVSFLPDLSILFEPAWLSLIVEGIMLGALANKLVDKTLLEKLAEWIESLFKK